MPETTYTVKKGDTLWGISKHFKITLSELAAYNNYPLSKAAELKINTVLKIPEGEFDTQLSIKILDLAFRPIKNAELKLEFDGKSTKLKGDGLGVAGPVFIQDHTKGLKIRFKDMNGKEKLIADHKRLPLGKKVLTLTTREMLIKGTTRPKLGENDTSTGDIRNKTKQKHEEQKQGQQGSPQQKTPQSQKPDSTPKPSQQDTGSSPEKTPPPSVPPKQKNEERGILGRIYDKAVDKTSEAMEVILGMPEVPPLNPPKTPTKVEKTTTEQGQTTTVIAVYNAENLRLKPANECYREMIIETAKKFGLEPQFLAAVINAEAAVIQNSGGQWNPRSAASGSNAVGLTQFLPATWLEVIKDRRSKVYQDKGGPSFTNHTEAQRLGWRTDAYFSIDAAALYAIRNMEEVNRVTGKNFLNLPPPEKAKMAYFSHHEGAGGTGKHLNKTLPDMMLKYRAQLGGRNNATAIRKVEDHMARFSGTEKERSIQAYTDWFYTYVDTHINVFNFLQNVDAAALPQARLTGEIISSYGGYSDPNPTPRSNNRPSGSPSPEARGNTGSTSSPPTSGSPQGRSGQTSPNSGSTNSTTPTASTSPAAGTSGLIASGWCNPLASCAYRTARLASWKSAGFGRVRNAQRRNHQGIDLIAVPGTQIKAVAHGIAYYVNSNGNAGYGCCVFLEVAVRDLPQSQRVILGERMTFIPGHPYPNGVSASSLGRQSLVFMYAHLTQGAGFTDSKFDGKNPGVRVTVEPGDILGKTGSSGNAAGMTTIASGAHLHFEVRLATAPGAGLFNRVDPAPFLGLASPPVANGGCGRI